MIETLYNKLSLENKSKFKKKIAKKTNRKLNTLNNHWFADRSGYAVPLEFENVVINELKRYDRKETKD